MGIWARGDGFRNRIRAGRGGAVAAREHEGKGGEATD